MANTKVSALVLAFGIFLAVPSAGAMAYTFMYGPTDVEEKLRSSNPVEGKNKKFNEFFKKMKAGDADQQKVFDDIIKKGASTKPPTEDKQI